MRNSRQNFEMSRISRNDKKQQIKKVRDKSHIRGMESAPQCKDLAPEHRPCTDKLQKHLEEDSGTTEGRYGLLQGRGTLEDQATGVKLEMCTKIMTVHAFACFNLIDMIYFLTT